MSDDELRNALCNLGKAMLSVKEHSEACDFWFELGTQEYNRALGAIKKGDMAAARWHMANHSRYHKKHSFHRKKLLRA